MNDIVEDTIKEISSIALDRSKKYNNGDQNYAFAFGWFVGEMSRTLSELNLTNKQKNLLKERLEQLSKVSN